MATASLGQWYNGISDDDYIGNPGTFAYSTDINVHKNPKALVLSAAPTNRLSLQSTDGSPNVVVNLSESGGNCTGTLVGTTQGKIYKDYVLKFTSAKTFKNILNVTIFTISGLEYLLIFRNGAIDRILTSDVESGNWAGITEDWKTYTVTALVNVISIINREGIAIIFGSGNSLYVLDKFATLTQVTILKTGEKIVGLTRTSDQLRVYTNRGDNGVSNTINGYQYFYNLDTVAATIIVGGANPTYTVEWKNLPISAVTNNGDTDYVITGLDPLYSSLYLSSGYQRVLLKRRSEGANFGQSKFNFVGAQNSFKTRNGMLYIPSNEGMYCYGEYYPGFGKGINLDFGLSQSGGFFGSAFTNNSMLLGHNVFGLGSITYWVSEIELSAKPSFGVLSGNYISRWITDAMVWQRKNIKEINVGYDLSGQYGGNIILSARTSESDSFTTFATISDTTKKNFRLFGINMPFHEFNKLQIQITLNKPNQDTSGPAVYDLTVNYDIIQG